jgi:hypothetical protein
MAPLAASTSGVTTGILFTQTLSPLLEGKLLNLTNGLVFGAGMMKDVGICTLGNVVGTADDINFRPGMTWYCTMLVTVAAGSALIAANGMPDKVNAASLGAKTVKTLFLSETAAIMPAFVTAALRIEKLGLVFRMSPMVLPAIVGTIGIAAGTSLLQEVDATTTSKISGRINLSELYIFFMIFFLFQ